MTPRRTALWCGAVLAAFLGIAALAVAAAAYRPALLLPLARWALAPRGGSAELAALKVDLRPLAVSLDGLSVIGPPPEGDILRMDHLRVEWIPGRLIRGGPWIRRVEAKRLVFERRRPREAKGPPDLTPLTRLFDIEELSLSDARLFLALPGGSLAAESVRMTMIPAEGGIRSFSGQAELALHRNGSTVARGSVSARGNVTPGPTILTALALLPARLDLPWIEGDVSARASLRVDRKTLHAEGLTLAIPQARIDLGPRARRTLAPIRLEASGSATLDLRDPRLEVLLLDIGGLLAARGTLRGPTLDQLSGTVEGAAPRIERLKFLFAPYLPDRSERIDVTGDLPFRARLAAPGEERVLTLELFPRDLSISWPEAGLACRIGGTATAAGPFKDWKNGKPRLNGRFQGTGSLERPPLSVRRFRFELPFAGHFDALALPGWRLVAGAGEALYEGRSLPLAELEVRGSARIAGGSVHVEGVDLRSGTLGRLSGEFDYHEGSIGGRLKGTGLPAAAIYSLAKAASGREGKDWSPGGAVDLDARFEPGEGGARLAAAVNLAGIGFSSPAGDVLGQNLAGKLDLEARIGERSAVSARLAMDRGEALWGTVYLNFADDPLDLRGRLARPKAGEYEEIFLDGGLAGFARLVLDGEARRQDGGWRHRGKLVLSDVNLGSVFRTFLRDPLASANSEMAGLRVDGTARMELSFSGSEKAARLDGRLRMRVSDVRREGDPSALSGLELDLPIAYLPGTRDPGTPMPGETAGWGRLAVKELRLGGQKVGPLEMPVALVPNRLYLGGEIETSLFGARLSLRRIEVREPLSPRFFVTLSARLDDLDLARIAQSSPPLVGRLGGELDPVRIDRDRLTASGELSGELFGGSLTVRRVTVDRPFHPGREFGADVAVARLDLEPLSAALGVGRITGRISGTLDGLRVAYGQPVAFHLKMQSVPEKGVSQLVSLKAVNSISLVSTGSPLTGLGSSLMARFFREFPYSKIGFECGLKNDVFTVRGLIQEDGVEYLVKRRLFAGINVINRNPDNRIGFSDMLERAKRATGERSP